ncbi:MAG: metal ABC transporter ATP-binding protein [Oscillospiraceae bacterium]|nr:metal ABC transporter ATP-binding protein [Oscillospiraceae bacterium]
MTHPNLHGGRPGDGCTGACCLKISDLSVTIGESTILHDVNLHLHCGEICALIGPNGAGKSTLFRAILGQIPHGGSITFELAGGTHIGPRIGYVPQTPTFGPGDPVSVFDLFSVSVSRYPVFLPTPKALRHRVEHCLERVHGEALIDKRVGALSGGELQRVLLAMALEPLPRILILDEPMSGVDIEGMKLLMDMLDDIRSHYDLSILISTHDFSMLERYADKVLLLKHTVLRSGPPDVVLSSPEFNAAFHLNEGRGPVS